MRTLLTVVGDGTATPVLETALLAARKFDGRVIGLNALTTEYAVVFGGEMGFSVSSEVDRTLERALYTTFLASAFRSVTALRGT